MEYKECYLEKINFVKELKEAIIKVQHNIIDIHYDVFVNKDDRVEAEYLVIEYNGGAKTVRDSYANSCSAIFKEMSNYLNHCYYDELETYEKIQQNNNLKKL